MKKIFLFAAAVVVSLSISSQKQMHVWMNGSPLRLALSKVDSVTFYDPNASTPDTPDIPEPDPNPDPSTAGGIGVFSVAEGKTVSFAPGNLQFNAVQGSHLRADGTTGKGTWRFAENQWDYIGNDNENIAENYDGWIDFFGWGTSGYNNTITDWRAINYQPYSNSMENLSGNKIDSTLNCEMYDITGECIWEYTYWGYSINSFGYGPSLNMMKDKGFYGTYYDWGLYNAISNDGNKTNEWRTLKYNEFYYIMRSRNNAKYLHSIATVNDIHGLILLPDNFKRPSNITWTHQADNWDTNTYSLEQWSLLENMGAVFLPAAGRRKGIDIEEIQNTGYYWMSSICDDIGDKSLKACCWGFFEGDGHISDTWRCYGMSVRLVKDL